MAAADVIAPIATLNWKRWRLDSAEALQHTPVRFLLLWLIYLVAIGLTISTAFSNPDAAPVWFPTGVALFLLTWWSPKLWPAIVLASLCINPQPTPGDIVESIVNGLEPALGAFLFLSLFKDRKQLAGLGGNVGMLAIGGIAVPTLFGLVMQQMGRQPAMELWTSEVSTWRTWLAGDFTAVLLITPLLAAFATERSAIFQWRRARILELVLASISLVVVSGLVFDLWQHRFPWADLGNEVAADAFLVFPVLVWIALRFCVPVSACAVFVSSALAILATLRGLGPYAVRTPSSTPLMLYGFITVIGLFTMLVAYARRDGERKEQALRASRAQYELLFRNNPHPMWVFECDTLRFVEVNDSAVAKYGYSREEFLSMSIKDIRPKEDVEKLMKNIEETRFQLRGVGVWRHLKKDGTLLEVEITGCSVDVDGQERRLVLANDITEKKRMETELRQSQKLEALGRLAGGVAHDFNNLIMIISSYAERLQYFAENPEKVRGDSERILHAADRAAALTRELLAFSRKQILTPKIIDLNQVVEDLLPMVRRLVGEDIDLQFVRGTGVPPIKIDTGQLTQVLLNLCANARDAMDRRGSLQITTMRVDTPGLSLSGQGKLPRGEYATLSVADNGCGMTPEIQERVFEPFFTTKEPSKGTGLGLATVYGIVKQSGGHIALNSTVGVGSTFVLYFPRVQEKAQDAAADGPKPLDTGTESVLVVEDEADLRSAVVESLRSLGYRVIHARDGRHALQVAEKLGTIDVLITDVVMPNMRGPELARYIRKMFPSIKIIFMSGYSDGLIGAELLDDETIFLAKPLSLSALASNIRGLLAAPRSCAG